MKISKRQLRRIIREEKTRLLSEQIPPDDPYASVGGPDPDYEANRSRVEDVSVTANKILDEWMTQLETKLYGKYPDEEVDAFSVEAMELVGGVERLLVKLIEGGYREDH